MTRPVIVGCWYDCDNGATRGYVAAVGDFDADGDPDIFDGHALWENKAAQGQANTFTRVTAPEVFPLVKAQWTSKFMATGGAFGDINRDGYLDLVLSFDTGVNSVLLYRTCTSSAAGAKLRPMAASACFGCPNFMRRGLANDVCVECDLDTITGGMPSHETCQFACPRGYARPFHSGECQESAAARPSL